MTAKKRFTENGVLGFLFAGPEKQIFFDPEAPPPPPKVYESEMPVKHLRLRLGTRAET